MQLFDLQTPQRQFRAELEARFRRILDHGQFISGPEVSELETELARRVGVRHAVACANGTDALLLALMAFDLQPGDEIITSAFSFAAAAEMAMLLGLRPVFVDIDPRTYNLNPLLLAAAITPKTKAIVPVNIYGQCCDYDSINAIARQHGLPVIEDAAQSFGASYRERPSGALGDVATTSFYPTKSLGAYGDAGAVFSDDDTLGKKIRSMRDHGQAGRYNHVIVGMNSRMDSFQAAVLLEKLKIFDTEFAARQRVAKIYDQAFAGKVEAPFIAPGQCSVYALYTLALAARDHVAAVLREAGVPTAIHYPRAIHQQPVYTAKWPHQSLPHTERRVNEVLSIPMHPYVTEAEQDTVIRSVLGAV